MKRVMKRVMKIALAKNIELAKRVKTGALYLLVLCLAAAFSALALWQWDRAGKNQAIKAELIEISKLPPTDFENLHQPAKSLDGASVNRVVMLSGKYLAFFSGGNQQIERSDEGRELLTGQFLIGLLQLDNGAGLLIAREFFPSALKNPGRATLQRANSELIGERVEILGRLLPSQREDRDRDAPLTERSDDLGRIDSALLVQDFTLPLYDGYVLLQREVAATVGSESRLQYPPDQIAQPTIPGYYWQHISYVFIWFLMAAITLYLPFYQRFRRKVDQELVVQSE